MHNFNPVQTEEGRDDGRLSLHGIATNLFLFVYIGVHYFWVNFDAFKSEIEKSRMADVRKS